MPKVGTACSHLSLRVAQPQTLRSLSRPIEGYVHRPHDRRIRTASSLFLRVATFLMPSIKQGRLFIRVSPCPTTEVDARQHLSEFQIIRVEIIPDFGCDSLQSGKKLRRSP